MSELLAAAAAALDVPEHLVERAANARAEADGTSFEEVLSAWAGGTPPPTATSTPAAPSEPSPATPTSTPASQRHRQRRFPHLSPQPRSLPSHRKRLLRSRRSAFLAAGSRPSSKVAGSIRFAPG